MLICFILLLLLCVIQAYKKTGFRLFINDVFWIFIWWGLIVGVYLFSGINYGGYGFSFGLVFFLTACITMYSFGRWLGKHTKITSLRNSSLPIRRTRFFKLVAWIGAILFAADYIRLNGLLSSGKTSYNLSIIGTVGNLFIPLLLVMGIHEFIECLQNKRKISISAIVMLCGYSLPCVLNSGRESIIYIAITLLAAFSYAKINADDLHIKVFKNHRTKYLILGLLAIGFIFLYKITVKRFGENEISVFLYYHDLPADRIELAEKFGDFKFIYYNVISYFSHQIPFLDFTLQTYSGPYLGGLYELNIISRRLPAFLGLDYRLVNKQLSVLLSSYGVQRYFSGGWNTVLGSLIFDFSAWGAPFVCLFLGYFVGNIRKKMLVTNNIAYGTLMSIVCGTLFSTIQLGPFYSFSICGAFIWWFFVYSKEH